MLHKKIEKYLSDLNTNIKDTEGLIELVDNSDGKGPFISKWNIEGIPKPTKEQLNNIGEDSIMVNDLKSYKISICKSYLDETDWYAIRELDLPDTYKDTYKTPRLQARMAINDLENLTTLEQVQNYDVSNFE